MYIYIYIFLRDLIKYYLYHLRWINKVGSAWSDLRKCVDMVDFWTVFVKFWLKVICLRSQLSVLFSGQVIYHAWFDLSTKIFVLPHKLVFTFSRIFFTKQMFFLKQRNEFWKWCQPKFLAVADVAVAGPGQDDLFIFSCDCEVVKRPRRQSYSLTPSVVATDPPLSNGV